MTTFLAIYRGQSVDNARIIAVATDTDLVSFVASLILRSSQFDSTDPVISAVNSGRRQALRLVVGGRDE